MKLDPTKVPKCCAHLTALAERWGIGDDIDREEAVAQASRAALEQLVDAIQSMPDDEMYDWLAGPASHETIPTNEYLAFTNMTMAYDSARLKLEKNGSTELKDHDRAQRIRDLSICKNFLFGCACSRPRCRLDNPIQPL